MDEPKTPRRRKGNRRKLHVSLKRKNGKGPLPEIVAPTIGPGSSVTFSVSEARGQVIIEVSMPIRAMGVTPQNARQFAAALFAAAEKAEGNKGGNDD